MTGLLVPNRGRRVAAAATPRLLTTPRWRALQRGLTLVVAGSAAIAGIQLGVTGPLTSPVQPPGAQAAGGAVEAPTGGAMTLQDRGRIDRRGGGGGRHGGGRR